MGTPLETLLNKYRHPKSPVLQTVTVAPNAAASASDTSNTAPLWNDGETNQSDLPQKVVDHVIKVRQEVLALFHLRDERDAKADQDAENAKNNDAILVLRSSQNKEVKAATNLRAASKDLLKKYDKFEKPSENWGAAPGRSYMFTDPRGEAPRFFRKHLMDSAREVQKREEEITQQLEELRKQQEAFTSPSSEPPSSPEEPEDPEAEPRSPEEELGQMQAKEVKLKQERLNVHIEWMKWMTLKRLMCEREGPPSAINTYDSAVVSWGMGWAYPGSLPEVIDLALAIESKAAGGDRERCYIQKLFYLCGFMCRDKVFRVINTTDKRVYAGKSSENNAALWTLHEEPALHSMWVLVASDELTRMTVFEAQRQVFFKGNATIAQGWKIQTAALYTFLAHLQHWTGDRTMDFIANAERLHLLDGVPLPSEEGDTIIANLSLHRFYCRRTLEGNAFYQFRQYWHQMAVDDAKEENTTEFQPSMQIITSMHASPTEIPANHVIYKVVDLEKFDTRGLHFCDLGHEDLFKTADRIGRFKPPAKGEKPFKPVQHPLGQGPSDLDRDAGYSLLRRAAEQSLPGTYEVPGGPSSPDPISPRDHPRNSTHDRFWSYRQAVGTGEQD